jgi:diguanylate cyclase (GGDEF)-like protein/PAS domain S-box-containing protein
VSIPLVVLIVEDSENDTQLILRLLRKAGYDLVFERIETAEEMRSALHLRSWDIIISNYSLPQFDGRAALELASTQCPDIPFIVISGTIGEDNAVAMMKAGAHDYLIKGNLARLGPTVQREIAQSVTRRERRRSEEALRTSEEKYRMLVEQASDAIFLVSFEGCFLDVNPAGCSLTGYSRQEILGAHVRDATRNLLGIPLYFERLRQGKVLISEREIVRKDGVKIWIEVSATRLSDGNFQGIARDVTQRKQMEQKLRQLSSAVEHGPSSILIANAEGRIEYVNLKFTEVTGFTLEEVLGRTPFDTFGATEMQAEARLQHVQTIRSGRDWHGEMLNFRKNGETYWASVSISPVMDANGSITHFVAVSEDITDRKEAEEKIHRLNAGLERLATTDYLTGLYNRRYFMQRGSEEFKRALRSNHPLSFLMLDVDHFKAVNDTHGHQAGDMALQQVAAALKDGLRETDILGRIGGEEFAVLLPDTQLNDAILLGQRICRSMEVAELSIPGRVLAISLTISVGIAGLESGMSGIEDVFRNADKALYKAKRNGRNRVMIYRGDHEISGISPAQGLNGAAEDPCYHQPPQ